MPKLISILIVSLSLFFVVPAHATRPDGALDNNGNHSSTICGKDKNGAPIYCNPYGGGKAHDKKNDHTELLLISVGVGVVFVGAMWYFFHKSPSENNPGQVKLAEF